MVTLDYIFDCCWHKNLLIVREKLLQSQRLNNKRPEGGRVMRLYLEMVELWAGEEAFAGTRAGVTWSAGLQMHS